jgi:hypothetical protein
MTIELTPTERAEFIDLARKELVAALIVQHKKDFDLISPAQAGGILDIAPNTLRKVPGLVQIDVIPRKVIRYKLSDIKNL